MLVVGNVDLRVEGLLDDALPDGGSVYAAQSPVGQNDRSGEIVIVCVFRRYESVTDPFAGERERLAPGEADDEIVDVGKGAGYGHACGWRGCR